MEALTVINGAKSIWFQKCFWVAKVSSKKLIDYKIWPIKKISEVTMHNDNDS